MFGAIRSQSGSSDNYWLFTGEQQDADSEMYYLRARYYDPAIGRFLSQDPLRSGNLYVYAGNNPTNRVDPSGLCIPGFNCPPGLGGGIFPPRLPISKEGGNFKPTSVRHPTPPCDAVPGSTCCYTSQEPWGFICGPPSQTGDMTGLLDALKDTGESIIECKTCSRIAHAALLYVQCTADPQMMMAGAYAAAATAQPEAWVVVVGGGCVAVVAITETQGVNPLHP